MDIMEFIQENWLPIFLIVYFLGMALYGYCRGVLRLAVSMAAFLVSFFPVRLMVPQVILFIKKNTNIHSWLREVMKKAVGLEKIGSSNFFLPAQQKTLIEGSPLPDTIKKILIENNNEKIYQLLGVDAFADYVGSFLADRIISTLVFVVLLLVIYIGIRVLVHSLDIISKLPILHGLNQISGSVLGLAEALIYFWIVCLLLTIFIGTSWGQYLLTNIEKTPWVFFLYKNNLLIRGLTSILWSLL